MASAVDENVYPRFVAPVRRFPVAAVHQLVTADHELRDALVASVDDEIVGLARYERDRVDPSMAEFAIVVQDDWRGSASAGAGALWVARATG